jgi:hypothetical protein
LIGSKHGSLPKRRGLSLKALDKILEVRRLAVSDLLPARREAKEETKDEIDAMVQLPGVSDSAAVI